MTTSGGPAAVPTPSPADEANAVVLSYLRKMGYRQTEQLFREEAHVGSLETLAFELRHDQDASISNYLLFSGAAEVAASHGVYEQAYQRLKTWAYDSLDVYREDLCQVLYPIGVHAYLDLVAKGHVSDAERFMTLLHQDHDASHGDELLKIEAVKDVAQMKECTLTAAFRTNKWNVTMSGYAFQLLMNYLQEGATNGGTPGNVLLLKIINQFVNIRVLVSKSVPGQAVSKAGHITGLTGVPGSTGAGVSLNKQPIKWGARPSEAEAEAIIAQNRPKDPSGRPFHSDQLTNAIAEYKKNFTQAVAQAPETDSIPRPSLGPEELGAEVARLKEIATRAQLSSTALPSVCCYTLHNSYDGITSISLSPDATLMATGNRDSYIDVWSLGKEPLRAIKPSTELAAMDLSDITAIDGLKEAEGSPTKRLVGHSGPVYATRFLPPTGQRLLLSASQDKTLRLWSLDLFAPIVIYRAHTLPVWDVDVPAGPAAGPYFVSGGADRTARLWSTAHIHPLRIFAGHLSDVDAVRFHPNASYVLTGSSDKTCRMWDVQTGACVRLLTGHERGVTALAVSPDGRLLASGDRLGHVRIWDLGEGKLLRGPLVPPGRNAASTSHAAAGSSPFASPESPVYSLAFDQDGRVLAQTGADATVHLWDAQKAASTSSLQLSTTTGGPNDLLLASYPTKQTPLLTCHFTPRNVLYTAGIYSPDLII